MKASIDSHQILYETWLSISAFTHKIWAHPLAVWQFRASFQKIQNQKFKRFVWFWPNSILKVLDRYIIFVCGFSTMAQTLWKLEPPQTFFKKFENPAIFQIVHQFAWKSSRLKGREKLKIENIHTYSVVNLHYLF